MDRTGLGIVGRGVELAVLEELLGHARAGRAQVVVVEGEPGMGKSALQQEFLDRHRDDAVIRAIRCDQLEQSGALALVQRLTGDGPSSASSDVAAGRSVLALLGDLQAGHDDVVVVAIDDAQWMDPASARALRFALGRLSVDRVLCLIARRPGPDVLGPVLSRDASATTVLRIGPLGAGDVGALVHRQRGWDLPIDVAQRVVARTGGVPLLVTAVVRAAAHLSDLESAANVPASATTEVAGMLAAVGTEARRLVEAAAVAAEPTELVVLGRIADLADPFAAASAAEAAGLVTVDATSHVACAHDLLGAAVYDLLPRTRRRELHAATATWTSGARRLAHRTAAADRPDPLLVADLVDAAAEARSALDHGVAADHLLRARTVSGDADERDALAQAALIQRVDAQDLAGAAELEEVARAASPSSTRSLALGLLARESGQVGPAATLLGEAVELAADDHHRARAAVAAAVLHVRMGSGALATETLAGTGSLDDAELHSDVVTTRAIGHWQTGDLESALSEIGDVPGTHGGSGWDADRHAVRGLLRMAAGQVPHALSDLDEAMSLVHLWRPSTNQSRCYVMRAMARFIVGQWDGAVRDAAAARAFARSAAHPWSMPMALAASADVPAARGQWDVAADYLVQARAALRDVTGDNMADNVRLHELTLHVEREDHHAVLDTLEPVWSHDYLHRLARIRDLRAVFQARIRASIGLRRLGEAEQDLATYEVLLRRFPGGPVPHRVGWLRGLLAEARGEPRLARHHYEADLVDPQTADAPLVHGDLLLASGRLERVLGNRREAVDRLVRARDLFSQLQAAPYVDRTAAELVACGLTSPSADPLALTQREHDVASLVVRGYTNREAAAELFVTAKTVEYHLRNIYAKLGIASRAELRRRLDPGLQ